MPHLVSFYLTWATLDRCQRAQVNFHLILVFLHHNENSVSKEHNDKFYSSFRDMSAEFQMPGQMGDPAANAQQQTNQNQGKLDFFEIFF